MTRYSTQPRYGLFLLARGVSGAYQCPVGVVLCFGQHDILASDSRFFESSALSGGNHPTIRVARCSLAALNNSTFLPNGHCTTGRL